MTFFFNASCDRCDFETGVSGPGAWYVVDDNGERIPCQHPGEQRQIADMLGLSEEDVQAVRRNAIRWWWLPPRRRRYREVERLLAARSGQHIGHLCTACLESFAIDPRRDPLRCPACGATTIIRGQDLEHAPCPACRAGTIRFRLLMIT